MSTRPMCFLHRSQLMRSALIMAALVALTRPAHAAALGGYVDVSAGRDHTCAVLATGRVECWGANAFGQLGNNTVVASSVPVEVQAITNAVQVSTGDRFSCAVLADGTVWCWGLNSTGQLGTGTLGGSKQVPEQAVGITGAKSVSAGGRHACAAVGVPGGTGVTCWGVNTNGQVGDGTINATATPVLLTVSNAISTVSAGLDHTCASTLTGAVLCWGLGSQGQLGGNSTASSLVPVSVNSIASVIAVEAGNQHSCARLVGNSLRCWGDNGLGQLGDGTLTQRLVPVPLPGLASMISAGGSSTCAVTATDGTVYCWGSDSATFVLSPRAVSFISTAVQVSVGLAHACARLSDGSLRCWGRNVDGQLGDGTLISSNVPVATLGGPCNLDIDGDGVVNGTTDALLLARAVAGQSSATLTNTILAPNAMRRTGSAVRGYLSTVCNMTGLAP